MTTPVTPPRTRPALGRRSRTTSGSFHSPARGLVPDVQDDRSQSSYKLSNEAGDGTKKQKSSQRGFFHTSHHEHKHHLPYLTKRASDAPGSKTSFLHSMHPVENLHRRTGERAANGAARSAGDRSFEQSANQVPEAKLAKVASGGTKVRNLEEAQLQQKMRERELRRSLNDMSGLVVETTRRLDQAFDSIKEKILSLRGTMSSLQEVSSDSKDLRASFNKDVTNVKVEVQAQINAFAAFENQQHAIDDLEARIKAGKKRTETLSTRLEIARRRVEQWEAREKEWQAKTSKRLTWGWICTLVLAFLIAALVTWKRIAYRTPSVLSSTVNTSNATLPRFIVDDLADLRARRQHAKLQTTSTTAQPLPTDHRLARFDEL